MKKLPNFTPSAEKIKDILLARERMGKDFPRFAVFVVAYNAAKTLKETLDRIPSEIYKILECIYVIDDFSQDETYNIGKLITKKRKWKKLKVFRNPKNYGYGGNQKIGYRYALEQGFDYVILLHGDGQYAPEFLPNLIRPALLEGKEVVFGSRMIQKGDALKGKMPVYKFLGNMTVSRLQNVLLNAELSEFHSGYRLYSTRVLSKIPFELNSDDFNFDSQIIIQCLALGVEIHEVPIPTHYGDEICYVDGVKYSRKVIRDAIGFRLHQLHVIRRNRYILEAEDGYRLKKSAYSSHQQVAGLVRPGTKALDIGCATGFLASLLVPKGVTVYGIDQVPEDRVSRDVAKYFRSDLENISGLDLGREFDYIIMGDVIEHIQNAKELLLSLGRMLKSDGRLIVSTGNIAIWFYRLSLLLGRFKYGPRGILDETHVKLYTLDTFRDLIISSGFKILSMRYTPIPFELVFQSRGRSRLPSVMEFIYYHVTKLWPRMLAYQFIMEAEVSALDFAREEGRIDLFSPSHPPTKRTRGRRQNRETAGS